VSYWNIRLLRRSVHANYKGVTHKYLNVLSGKTRSLEGIGFIDHGTESNRGEKYERDVRLLTNAIATERSPGMIARYTFSVCCAGCLMGIREFTAHQKSNSIRIYSANFQTIRSLTPVSATQSGAAHGMQRVRYARNHLRH
jgi:hypothetical protein